MTTLNAKGLRRYIRAIDGTEVVCQGPNIIAFRHHGTDKWCKWRGHSQNNGRYDAATPAQTELLESLPIEPEQKY